MEVHQSHSDTDPVPHKYSCLFNEIWFLSQSQPDWGLNASKNLQRKQTKPTPNLLLSFRLSNAFSESQQREELNSWPLPLQPPPFLLHALSLVLLLVPSGLFYSAFRKAPHFSKYWKINNLNKTFCFKSATQNHTDILFRFFLHISKGQFHKYCGYLL